MVGLSGDVEEMNAQEDDNEADEERECVGSVGGIESLEKDGGRYYGAGCKTDVVHGIDNISGKQVESFVEVVHLDHDAYCGDDQEYISAGVGELVATSQGELDSDPEALY